jgi:hypothetical protein
MSDPGVAAIRANGVLGHGFARMNTDKAFLRGLGRRDKEPLLLYSCSSVQIRGKNRSAA